MPNGEPRERGGPPSGLGRRSVRGFLVTSAAWGANRLVVLAVTLVLARLLVPADFGLVTAGLAVVTFLDAALDLGVGAAVVHDQDRGVTRRVRSAATLSTVLSAGIAVVGVACAPLMARAFDQPDATSLFAVLFVYPLLRGAGQVSDAVLRRDLRFGRRSVVEVVRAVVRLAVSWPLGVAGAGAFSIVAGILASELVALVVLQCLSPVRLLLRPRRADLAPLVKFGGTVTGIRILGSYRNSVDSVIIGSVLGAAPLGFYGIAVKLPELLIANVLWIFSTVAFPSYARAREEGVEVLRRAVLVSTRMVSFYGFAAGSSLAVLAAYLVPVLFGPGWGPAVVPMVLISGGLAWMAVGWANGDAFPALGRPGVLLRLDVPVSVVLTVALVLVAPGGVVPVACAHLVANAAYAVARIALVVRVVGLSYRAVLLALVPAFSVAALVAGVGLLAHHLVPPAGVAELALAGGAVALTVVLVTGVSFGRDLVRRRRDGRAVGAPPAVAGAVLEDA